MYMKKVKFILLMIVTSIMVSCGTTSTVPITGRKHRLSVSDEQVLSLSAQEYTKYMQSAKASTNAANTAMVKRVGQKLANAVETYLNTHGFANEVKYFNWEFNLVQDQSANAFCMPGGKIVVYEGILPITQDEASLAIVLGHEIAHAVAKHSAEQMSKATRSQTGLQIGSGILSAIGVDQGIASAATSIASQGLQLMNLKYSRDNESEADHMGLVFAAMAGYDPNVAISFWKRMSASGGSGTPAFLSSHPSDEKRIADIQKHLPEAMQYYKGGTTSTTTTKATTKNTTTKKSTAKASKTTKTLHVK